MRRGQRERRTHKTHEDPDQDGSHLWGQKTRAGRLSLPPSVWPQLTHPSPVRWWWLEVKNAQRNRGSLGTRCLSFCGLCRCDGDDLRVHGSDIHYPFSPDSCSFCDQISVYSASLFIAEDGLVVFLAQVRQIPPAKVALLTVSDMAIMRRADESFSMRWDCVRQLILQAPV